MFRGTLAHIQTVKAVAFWPLKFPRKTARAFAPVLISQRFFKRWPAALALLLMAGCGSARPTPQTVTMVIESSPTSLDPRIGVDAQSEHIGSLIFDSLVHKNAHFEVEPWLATSWETPDPVTYRFHLRSDVHFHDGRPLTSADVKYTLDSMRDGTVITAKAAALTHIDHVDAPDPTTVVIHLKQADATLLWNLCDGAMGVVPSGSNRNFGLHPVGSGPFRFVSQMQDDEVILERNEHSWQPVAPIARLRFAVVPDAITRALELEKGSADACISCMTADMVDTLATRPDLVVQSAPGTVLNYINFNAQDSILKDVRVRQSIAYAMNRPLIIHSLWRDRARLADSLLPPEHWAWTGDLEHYPYDPAKANALLDSAGWKRGKNGVRFRLTMKTSTDETSRLLALILQQELRDVGIALEVRSFEFATFFSDVTKGAFQMYTLRWVGNEDPQIFNTVDSHMFPPHGNNRGRYANPALDALIKEGGMTSDQAQRRAVYVKVQQILAADLPSINLWYLDSVLVHTRRLENVEVSGSGTFDFLRSARVAP
jgi:peptide/nickel transport system substrate-binding protein